ncbi:uncharacterized protein LOC108704284 [Xenopus laevis]|uniref:Uncharacterized protein LOC108704284 n=1 Tax=Xenopus laevis TaxID=8355 RepID=A0A8J0U480_XENLA|nr:uncharacterized protein LOC108704284 [Xenopus laevis]XP_018096273.1 uncharacterized protein LOC108704284 [Xenopus laevis]
MGRGASPFTSMDSTSSPDEAESLEHRAQNGANESTMKSETTSHAEDNPEILKIKIEEDLDYEGHLEATEGSEAAATDGQIKEETEGSESEDHVTDTESDSEPNILQIKMEEEEDLGDEDDVNAINGEQYCHREWDTSMKHKGNSTSMKCSTSLSALNKLHSHTCAQPWKSPNITHKRVHQETQSLVCHQCEMHFSRCITISTQGRSHSLMRQITLERNRSPAWSVARAFLTRAASTNTRKCSRGNDSHVLIA